MLPSFPYMEGILGRHTGDDNPILVPGNMVPCYGKDRRDTGIPHLHHGLGAGLMAGIGKHAADQYGYHRHCVPAEPGGTVPLHANQVQ